ncbi:neither inactivation nor afterpotential protein G isoform X2 [Maniola hyperantus]|uniref:neither inactivation nor afterpotential protein G isoform X1 n=1 Tax=Aphantopus hyperantus TaxID=2795564 RepID=UPI00156A26AF|nr:neither inactivation nor afterpotential protein G isoform X1 [Maniola hyperantus]
MAVLSYLISVLVACVSYVLYHKYANVYSSFVAKPDKRYDYIIVGAGTAGCVLASRLSENPEVKVLLIEAGDHMGYFTKIPLTATAAQQGPNDWSIRATSQKYSSFGLWNQSPIIPRGKGPGGSGQINFLLHGFGLPEDYNRWSRLGFKGWTMDDLKPYFLKAFGTVRSEFDSDMCPPKGFCAKAPMKLKLIDDHDELMTVFKQASSSIADNNTLFRKATASVKDGSRYQAYDAYLKPVLTRPNLHVLLGTQGISIRFENKKVSSLYILRDHRNLDNIFVNKEIILSAGSLKTPQIMILSGIGPRNLINRLRLNLISANEHVGQNLHDHLNLPIYVSIKQPISVTLAKVFSPSTLWDYYWKNSGYLAFPPVAGVEYQNSSALMLFSMGSTSERLLRGISNYRPQVFHDLFPFLNDTVKEGFMFLATCIQPRSRGSVTLKDSSTSVPIVVDPNYLHREYDVKCMVKAIRRAEKLVSTKPFQSIGARIHWPRSERCLMFWNYTKQEQIGLVKRRKKIKSPSDKKLKEIPKPKRIVYSPPDAYLECMIREAAVTGHHAAGTCAGGRVVDEYLRVKNVIGVRIMDASVFPSPISLYPNSVVVAMAEKAADVIRHTPN